VSDPPPQLVNGRRQSPGHSSVRRNQTVVCCAVCERTLLLGEAVGLFHDGTQPRQVCLLCTEGALARGWLREGSPSPPPAPYGRGPSLLQRLRRRGREPGPAPVPVLHPGDPARRAATRAPGEPRVQAAEDAVAAGVDLFNGSAYRRTVSGIAKSLGRPRVSVVPLGGIRPDVVVTVAWDISWYQYRVDADASPAVRLEGRGDDLLELDPRWRAWNAQAGDDGSVVIEGSTT
jgi:hypothetical protein